MRRGAYFAAAFFAAAAPALAQRIDEPRTWTTGGILVTEGDITSCPYRVVRQIDANVHTTTLFGKRPDPDKVVREMRERVNLGEGDAIVRFTISPEHAMAVWGRVVTGSGQLVRFASPCEHPEVTAAK